MTENPCCSWVFEFSTSGRIYINQRMYIRLIYDKCSNNYYKAIHIPLSLVNCLTEFVRSFFCEILYEWNSVSECEAYGNKVKYATATSEKNFKTAKFCTSETRLASAKHTTTKWSMWQQRAKRISRQRNSFLLYAVNCV